MLILLLKPIGQRLIVQERTAVVPGLMVVRMIFVQPARVPTKTALEDDTTSETNSASVFSSFLKLPAAGYRQYSSGSIALRGSSGYYWSSTTPSAFALTSGYYLLFNSSSSGFPYTKYGNGFSVRCIKD